MYRTISSIIVSLLLPSGLFTLTDKQLSTYFSDQISNIIIVWPAST